MRVCHLAIITKEIAYFLSIGIPTSVTLNDLERCNSPYFASFHQIR